MNLKTLRALRSSIRHWKRLANGRVLPDENVGASHCALCLMFRADFEKLHWNDCKGCPVMERTEVPYCRKTPYNHAEDIYNDIQIEIQVKEGSNLQRADFKAAALKELNFLRSLLPGKLGAKYRIQFPAQPIERTRH